MYVCSKFTHYELHFFTVLDPGLLASTSTFPALGGSSPSLFKLASLLGVTDHHLDLSGPFFLLRANFLVMQKNP